MPQLVRGYPWEGLEYNERLSPRITRALGGAIMRANAERHPGLYQASYRDVPTIQVSIRPALIVPPNRREQWLELLSNSIGRDDNNGR